MYYKYKDVKIKGSTFIDEYGTSYPVPHWFDGVSLETLKSMDISRHPDPVFPSFDQTTHKAVQDANGEWEVVPKTTDEIESLKTTVVTMRQARLALLGAGLLASVDEVIAKLPSPQKEAAQVEWEYAVTVDKHSPLVVGLIAGLGITAEQIDGLFEIAGGIL